MAISFAESARALEHVVPMLPRPRFSSACLHCGKTVEQTGSAMWSGRRHDGTLGALHEECVRPFKASMLPDRPKFSALPCSFDAREWAHAFVAHVKAYPEIPTNEETMASWFANALQCGFDEGAKRAQVLDQHRMRPSHPAALGAPCLHCSKTVCYTENFFPTTRQRADGTRGYLHDRCTEAFDKQQAAEKAANAKHAENVRHWFFNAAEPAKATDKVSCEYEEVPVTTATLNLHAGHGPVPEPTEMPCLRAEELTPVATFTCARCQLPTNGEPAAISLQGPLCGPCTDAIAIRNIGII